MARIGFDAALGFHEQSLLFRTRRASVLANNIANADTPQFKARDMAFPAALRLAGMQSSSALRMKTTHSMHSASGENLSLNGEGEALLYRVPSQQGIDGNTVDANEEVAAFTQNAIDFAASFRFLNGRFKGLSKAIRGE
ncbi:flagellar basal body rod protein FlgB [bacterium]|nr:flagellar basal body rod protein FlgB [bacterium]